MRKALPLLLAGCLFGAPRLAPGADGPAPARPAHTAPATGPATAPANDPAARALAELQSARPPELDASRRGDRQYVQAYVQERQAFLKRQAEAAKAFADKYPDHPEATRVLLHRWLALAQSHDFAPVLEESEKTLKAHPDAPEKNDVLFIRAMVTIISSREAGDARAAGPAVEEFLKAAPKDERGAQLLTQLARLEPDEKKQAEIQRRLVEQYPDSEAAAAAKGTLHQLDGVGKPFELAFTDAIGGKPVSIKDLKGKVVVVDFWATWCGPCVSEMPHMKELYAKYKDQGVQFIGVSLDQPESEGGLTALKSFVQQNGITWPQYYQGNGWESEFSRGWGVNSIPCVFIVDAEGRLHSPSARGELEKMIPELLQQHGGSTTRPAEKGPTEKGPAEKGPAEKGKD